MHDLSLCLPFCHELAGVVASLECCPTEGQPAHRGSPSAASDAPLLGLGCQSLLVSGAHALRHGEQEAWPQQGGSRIHSTGHVCKNRAKNALTGKRSCAFTGRGTRAHIRAVFVVLAVLAVAFGSTVIESNPARAGDRELSCGAGELPESETRSRHLSRFQDSVRDRRRIRERALTESDAPDAARTLETPYTGSSSRPLQSPFGPYPYLAAAAATSLNFGGGSAFTRSDQLTFA